MPDLVPGLQNPVDQWAGQPYTAPPDLRQPPPTPQKPPYTVVQNDQADPLAPVMQKIKSGESGGSDPYHETYGGGHFGWQGIPNTGSGAYGFVKTTWERAAPQYMAANPGQQPPDFNNPQDQDKVARFWAQKTYREKTGRDLATDAQRGKVDYQALAGQWPSLDPNHGMYKGWADEDRSTHQQSINSATDIQREMIRLAEEEPPGSQKRLELLQRAQEASERATESFERLSKTPPHYQPLDVMQNFGSAAVLLSVIGGLFARRPLTASLGAAGVAMQAQNQQNWDQFKIANEQWKTQADLGLAQARLAHDQIREVMDDERLAESQKQDKINNLFRTFQIGTEAQRYNQDFQLRTVEALQRAHTQGIEAVERQTQLNNFTELTHDREAFDQAVQSGDTAGMQKSAQDLSKTEQKISDFSRATSKAITSPQSLAFQQFMAENPGATSEQQQAFLQRSRPGRSGIGQIMQKFFEEHPNATADETSKFYAGVLAQSTAERAVTSGKAGDTIRTFSVSISHLDVLQEAAAALRNGEIQRFNSSGNRLESEFGDPRPANFDAIRTIVGSEVNKAIQGGIGALTDREELRNSFSLASSPEQLNGVIHQLKRLIAGQLEGFRRQYQDILTSEEFDRKLSPAAQKELGGLAPSAAQSAGPPAGTVDSGYRFKGGDPKDKNNWEPIQ